MQSHMKLPPEDVYLVTDVSPSMGTFASLLATRLGLARSAIQRFAAEKTARCEADRVGLIVFDWEPQVILQSTEDYATVQRATRECTILGGGTDIERALRLACTELASSPYARRIVLLTDGIEEQGRAEAVLPTLCALRIVVDAIWIGDGARPHILDALATRTGGCVATVADITTLPRCFAALAHEKKLTHAAKCCAPRMSTIHPHRITPRTGPPCG